MPLFCLLLLLLFVVVVVVVCCCLSLIVWGWCLLLLIVVALWFYLIRACGLCGCVSASCVCVRLLKKLGSKKWKRSKIEKKQVKCACVRLREEEAVAWYAEAQIPALSIAGVWIRMRPRPWHADQRHVNAESSLGWCFDNGVGVMRNEAEAVAWYRRAAEQENIGAPCKSW